MTDRDRIAVVVSRLEEVEHGSLVRFEPLQTPAEAWKELLESVEVHARVWPDLRVEITGHVTF